MKVSSFLKLVEIQTKVASLFPFLFGTLYAVWTRGSIKWLPALIMLVSLLCIDMATTAVNNYMDFKRAIRREGYGYEIHNAIVKDQVEIDRVKLVILTLLGIGLIFGLILVWMTDWIVLVLGVISAGIGIVYSYGPVPISRTPLGEVFSGGFMGILIPFLAFYIQFPPGALIEVAGHMGWTTIGLDAGLLIRFVLICVPFAAGIANIMLANNLCDLEEDLANRRYTLVAYIGRGNGIKLYQGLVILAYLILVIGTAIGWLPVFTVLAIATGLPVYKLTRVFCDNPVKSQTFVNAVKSFVMLSAGLLVSMGLAVAFEMLW